MAVIDRIRFENAGDGRFTSIKAPFFKCPEKEDKYIDSLEVHCCALRFLIPEATHALH